MAAKTPKKPRYPVLKLSEFGMTKRGKKARARRAAHVVLAAWKSQARKEFRTKGRMYRAYLKALAIGVVEHNRATVELPNPRAEGKGVVLALMSEFGMGAGGIGSTGSYDIRRFALRWTYGTKKLRYGKNGPYRAIPFKHTMTSIKKQGGADIETKVKSDQFKLSVAAGKHRTVWGSRLTLNDTKHVRKLKEHHVSNPLAGLVKQAAGYKKGVVQTKQTTFRTMSWAGQPWMHPGVKPLRIGDKVRNNLADILKGVL
jgi:hypothetical protein